MSEQGTTKDLFSAVEEFDQWNDVTGAIPKGIGWYYECRSIMEDADKEIARLESALETVSAERDHLQVEMNRVLEPPSHEPFPDPDVAATDTAAEPEPSNDWGVRESFKTIESYIQPGSALPGAVRYLKLEIRKLEKMVMEESTRAAQPPLRDGCAPIEQVEQAWRAFIERRDAERAAQPPGDG
jgi:hypothetical protein